MRYVLAVLVALGLGFFLGRSSIAPPLENSPEVIFARDMRAHHMQAVDMATRVRDVSKDELLRLLATDMLLTQQNELGQMQAWLNAWGLPLTGREPPMNGEGEKMGLAAQSDVSSLSLLPVKASEIKFLQLMIRHHQGGVMMAESLLQSGSKEIAKTLAFGIVRNQKIEIETMRSFLKKRGATELPALVPLKMNHN
jgi:uncharacterized protein (DUF305 family)